MKVETYLGDGAYASYDGFETVIYTSDGISVTNRVVLEPDGVQRLVDWIAELRLSAKKVRL